MPNQTILIVDNEEDLMRQFAAKLDEAATTVGQLQTDYRNIMDIITNRTELEKEPVSEYSTAEDQAYKMVEGHFTQNGYTPEEFEVIYQMDTEYVFKAKDGTDLPCGLVIVDGFADYVWTLVEADQWQQVIDRARAANHPLGFTKMPEAENGLILIVCHTTMVEYLEDAPGADAIGDLIPVLLSLEDAAGDADEETEALEAEEAEVSPVDEENEDDGVAGE